MVPIVRRVVGWEDERKVKHCRARFQEHIASGALGHFYCSSKQGIFFAHSAGFDVECQDGLYADSNSFNTPPTE